MRKARSASTKYYTPRACSFFACDARTCVCVYCYTHIISVCVLYTRVHRTYRSNAARFMRVSSALAVTPRFYGTYIRTVASVEFTGRGCVGRRDCLHRTTKAVTPKSLWRVEGFRKKRIIVMILCVLRVTPSRRGHNSPSFLSDFVHEFTDHRIEVQNVETVAVV